MYDLRTFIPMEPTQTPPDSKWLKDLQKRSWEPEVLISGITLAFLFSFPSQLVKLAAWAIQEVGVPFLGAWILLLYLSSVVSMFKLFFISHLALRMAWAGLLGLSYAFPKGVIKENLFKQSQDLTYATPTQLVLRLERICSMVFAFPVSIGMIVFSISTVLVALLTVQVAFGLDFFTVYMLFIVLIFAFSLYNLLTKNTRFRQRLATRLDATIQSIYQSNLGKWTVIGYVLTLIAISIPLTMLDTQNFRLFFNQAQLPAHQIELPESSFTYESHADPDRRFPRAMVPYEVADGTHLPIRVAFYAEDASFVKQLNSEFPITLDTLNWHAIEKPEHLLRVFVNDSLVSIDHWRTLRTAGSRQAVMQGLMDASALKSGYNDIRIEKLVVLTPMFGQGAEPRHRTNWAAFSVIRP
jgi:hypothetical protein